MVKLKSVAEHWIDFAERVLPMAAGELQRQEMRRAFYAGFVSCMQAVHEMADATGTDDDAGVAMLERLFNECTRFAHDVERGRA